MLRAHWVTFGVTVVPAEAIGAATLYDYVLRAAHGRTVPRNGV